jgi:hypothetical protein
MKYLYALKASESVWMMSPPSYRHVIEERALQISREEGLSYQIFPLYISEDEYLALLRETRRFNKVQLEEFVQKNKIAAEQRNPTALEKFDDFLDEHTYLSLGANTFITWSKLTQEIENAILNGEIDKIKLCMQRGLGGFELFHFESLKKEYSYSLLDFIIIMAPLSRYKAKLLELIKLLVEDLFHHYHPQSIKEDIQNLVNRLLEGLINPDLLYSSLNMSKISQDEKFSSDRDTLFILEIIDFLWQQGIIRWQRSLLRKGESISSYSFNSPVIPDDDVCYLTRALLKTDFVLAEWLIERHADVHIALCQISHFLITNNSRARASAVNHSECVRILLDFSSGSDLYDLAFFVYLMRGSFTLRYDTLMRGSSTFRFNTHIPSEEDLKFLFKNLDITGFNFIGISYKGQPVTNGFLKDLGIKGADKALTTLAHLDVLPEPRRSKLEKYIVGKITAAKIQMPAKNEVVRLVPLRWEAINGNTEIIMSRFKSGESPNPNHSQREEAAIVQVMRSYIEAICDYSKKVDDSLLKAKTRAIKLFISHPQIDVTDLHKCFFIVLENGEILERMAENILSFIDLNKIGRDGCNFVAAVIREVSGVRENDKHKYESLIKISLKKGADITSCWREIVYFFPGLIEFILNEETNLRWIETVNLRDFCKAIAKPSNLMLRSLLHLKLKHANNFCKIAFGTEDTVKTCEIYEEIISFVEEKSSHVDEKCDFADEYAEANLMKAKLICNHSNFTPSDFNDEAGCDKEARLQEMLPSLEKAARAGDDVAASELSQAREWLSKYESTKTNLSPLPDSNGSARSSGPVSRSELVTLVAEQRSMLVNSMDPVAVAPRLEEELFPSFS